MAIVFRFTDLDLTLQRLAWRASEPHWPYGERQPWALLRDYGTWPGTAIALAGLAMVAVSFVRHSARRWRYPALFVFLFFALGPGLLTNLGGKMLYGRPRPDEIAEFGGSLRFHRVFELGHPGMGFSFLCGHCSMGYLLFAFFFLWRGLKRWIALCGAAALGLLIGVARVLQAAHFPSDVLLDATLMFALGAAISPIASREPKPVILPKWKVALIAAIVALLTLSAFLFSSPVHKEWTFLWIPPGQRAAPSTRQDVFPWRNPARVLFAVQKGNVRADIGPQPDPLRVHTLVKGFGFPGAGNLDEVKEFDGGRIVSFEDRLTGAYWEVHGSFVIWIDAGVNALSLTTGDGDVVLHERRCPRPLQIGGNFALVDPSHRFIRSGNAWVRPGTGPPIDVAIAARRVVIP